MKKVVILLAVMAITSIARAQSPVYTMDKNHSRLSFSVKHLGISRVEGNFKSFNVSVVSSKDDYSDAKIEMTADVKSINTEVEMRDNDLRGPNWFDSEKYPTLTFKSTEFKKVGEDTYKLVGNITIHGVTKPITLDVEFNGKIQNQRSKKFICGFTITGKLNRADFGVGGSEFGMVGNEIKLTSNVEFVIS